MVEVRDEDKEQSVAKKIKLDSIDQGGDDGLSEKIKQQLDYYFSDVNIIKDKFLLEEIKKDDGWVKLSVLLTFQRLQQLTKDESRIVEALQQCKSNSIELDETKRQVRRKNKLPDIEAYKKELDLRTVHVSDFPTDYSFENLRTFCSQFGEVESVAMRRHFKTRLFKGCIHVVYKQVEGAKKLLSTEPLKCKDRELRSESMEQYQKRKAEMAQKRMENRKKRKDGDGKSTEKDSYNEKEDKIEKQSNDVNDKEGEKQENNEETNKEASENKGEDDQKEE